MRPFFLILLLIFAVNVIKSNYTDRKDVYNASCYRYR